MRTALVAMLALVLLIIGAPWARAQSPDTQESSAPSEIGGLGLRAWLLQLPESIFAKNISEPDEPTRSPPVPDPGSGETHQTTPTPPEGELGPGFDPDG